MKVLKNISSQLVSIISTSFCTVMRYCFLTIISFFLAIISLSAQHTIAVTPKDTVYLDIDTWRGDLQWQLSHDKADWTDLSERTSDTIKYVPDQFPSYFRVQITDGDCAPHYSEIVEVIASQLPTVATLATIAPWNITETTAETGGEITDAGGASITARGVVYDTNPDPTLDDLSSDDGTGDGSFSTLLSGLTANTTYYVRAYATNSAGTAYGDEYSFKTDEKTISLPTVITVEPHNIGVLTAETGGEITDTGGASITARGMAYGRSPEPTLDDLFSDGGTGDGSFSILLSGLTANTTYYVRAYATNSAGTAYGDEHSFKTNEETISLPTVITVEPHNLGMLTAETGGEITGTGGASITARGIVYDTNPGPTLGDFLSDSGTGDGSFSILLITLMANKTYYVRAYATNSMGTAYGEEYSFTTLPMTAYAVGDQGPAGGIIFYDKGFFSNGWRYLEAAPAGWNDPGPDDAWVDLEWGCYEILIDETSTDIGTGKENTLKILANGCAGADNAVRLAADATINGYTDWFLPSRDELHELYHNLNNLGPNFHSNFGYLTFTYTSSSELNDISGWGLDFGTGSNVQHLKKIATIAVRPVRRF